MTDPLILALGEDRAADMQAELDDLRAEVEAHRAGHDMGWGHFGHCPVAEDPDTHEECVCDLAEATAEGGEAERG